MPSSAFSKNTADAKMPPGYSTQQKNAISQFSSITSLDRNSAIRVSQNLHQAMPAAPNMPVLTVAMQMLKSHNWDTQNAVNA